MPMGHAEGAGAPIARALGPRQRPAIERMLGDQAKTPGAVDRFLMAAEAHGIDLRNLWASFDPQSGAARQTCLAVVGAGRSAMIFVSTPSDPPGEIELARVVNAACEALDDVVIAQALLEPSEASAASGLKAAGWSTIAELAYLRRPRRGSDGKLGGGEGHDAPVPVDLRTAGEVDKADIVQALEDSYIGTLDCPELCGLRRTSDVIESHRATGHYDPEMWTVVYLGGEPCGAVLLNPTPEQASVELVYIGIGPRLRGRGMGAWLLRRAIGQIASRSERELTCAVDLRNEPAMAMYKSFGFQRFALRNAMVLPLAPERS